MILLHVFVSFIIFKDAEMTCFPLLSQPVKMRSWVFAVAVLLSSLTQAGAQGMNHSLFL